MATKKGNGHDGRQVDLLVQILDELRASREELHSFRLDVTSQLEGVENRLGRMERLLHETVGKKMREQEKRLETLEHQARVNKA